MTADEQWPHRRLSVELAQTDISAGNGQTEKQQDPLQRSRTWLPLTLNDVILSPSRWTACMQIRFLL